MTDAWKNRFQKMDRREDAKLRDMEALAPPIPKSSNVDPLDIVFQSPIVAEKALELTHALHHNSSLPASLRELTILIVARMTTAQYEWYVHAPMALKAGVSAHIVEDLRNGRAPSSLSRVEVAVYMFAVELLRTHQVSDEVFEKARGQLSSRQIVDLVMTIGSYVKTSYLINACGVSVPEGVAEPLPKIVRFPLADNGDV